MTFEQDDGQVQDVLNTARSRTGTSTGLTSAERRSSYVGWFAQIHMDKQPQHPVVISPEAVTLTWHEDLSAEQTVTAAPSYWADPETRVPIGPETPAPGAQLSDTRFGPGEFGIPDTTIPGDSARDIHELLSSFGLPPNSGAGDIMESIDSVMSLWTLTNKQHARLLEMLLEAGDVELLGTATDRAGRSVAGIRAEPGQFPGTSRTLLISVETGRIIGIETTRTIAEPPLEAGDVVASKLWEITP